MLTKQYINQSMKLVSTLQSKHLNNKLLRCFCATMQQTNVDKSEYIIQSALINELKGRGYLAQCNDIVRLDKRIAEYEQHLLTNGNSMQCLNGVVNKPLPKPMVAYIGFDATASSLHAGSLIQLMILRCLQKHHHQVICLLGGGTTRIGDPSGKDEARPLYTEDMITSNCESIKNNVLKKLLFNVDAGDTTNSACLPPLLLNNDEWLNGLEYVSFLRDIGRYFSINRMLNLESVKTRLQREQSLSFLEFNYSILQAFDYYHLHKTYGAELQIGGSDQWGNIVSGIELIHRVPNEKHSIKNEKEFGVERKDLKSVKEEVFGWTSPLLLTSSGAKMGKSVVGGTIWLDGSMCSPYDYWQYWRTCSDDDVIRYLKLFTELPLAEIHMIEQNLNHLAQTNDSSYGVTINQLKIQLADRVTEILHGRDCLTGIHQTTKQFFDKKSGVGASGDMKVFNIQTYLESISNEINSSNLTIVDLLYQSGLTKSKNEARRALSNNSVRINHEVVENDEFLTCEAIQNSLKQKLKKETEKGNDHVVEECILSNGKKKHIKIKF